MSQVTQVIQFERLGIAIHNMIHIQQTAYNIQETCNRMVYIEVIRQVACLCVLGNTKQTKQHPLKQLRLCCQKMHCVVSVFIYSAIYLIIMSYSIQAENDTHFLGCLGRRGFFFIFINHRFWLVPFVCSQFIYAKMQSGQGVPKFLCCDNLYRIVFQPVVRFEGSIRYETI